MHLDLKVFHNTPVLPECFVSIVIPVRDEAEYLSKTFQSLVNQIDLNEKPLAKNTFEILILANNCQDDSYKIALKQQQANRCHKIHAAEISLPKKNANIGFVRRILMDEAARRLKSNRFSAGIILTTDGDTWVAPDWIAQNIAEIERGADAVGGRILLDAEEFAKLDAKTKNFHLLDEEYRLLVAEIECFFDNLPHNDVPRHHQNFNGSFAVTIDAYERAGGIPDVKFLEDVAFYNALQRIDAKFRHSPNVRVFTSARNVGRTALGLSTQLNEWRLMGKNGKIYLVESAQSIEKRVSARKKLRELQRQAKTSDFLPLNEILLIAETLGIPAKWLFKEVAKSQTFGCLLEKIHRKQIENGVWSKKNSLVPVETAIADLQRKLEKLRSPKKHFDKSA